MINPFKIATRRKPTSENARHARRASVRRKKSVSFVILIATILFLFLPLVVVIVDSFNEAKSGAFTRFSLDWYRKLFFESDDLWQALLNSLLVAITSAAVSTLLGTLAAMGTAWHKFRGRGYINVVSFLPMVLPEVILGIAMLIFFSSLKIQLGLFTIFVAHTTFCLPFVFLMVLARLDEFDFSTMEAAYDLGATEVQTITKVVIPTLMPGIAAGFLMSVTLSLEDFVITFFVSGPGSTTLPLYVYSMIRFGVSPVINALSFIMILVTMLFAFLGKNFLKTFAAAK